MRCPRRALVVLSVLILAAFVSPGVILAHALLVRANPVAESVLQRSPDRVHLWFSEDLDPASRIIVWDRYRHEEQVGQAVLVPGQSRQMEVRLKPLVHGTFLVLWTSVSAQDGHILRGSYLFSVGARGPGPSLVGVSLGNGTQGFPDTTTLLSILAHWIELLGAVTWFGSAAISLWVVLPLAPQDGTTFLSRESAGTARLTVAALIALLGAGMVLLALRAHSLANFNWSQTLTTASLHEAIGGQYGMLWVFRQILVCASLVITCLPAANITPSRIRRIIPTVLSLLYLYLFAASSHAASANVGALQGSHIVSVAVAMDWIHLIADGLWLGGQVFIVVTLARATAGDGSLFLRMLGRFSPLAYSAIVLYIVSGVFSAKIHIPSWYAFFHSVYGWTLVVKMVLIGIMMLISVYTVFLLRPRIAREQTKERRSELLAMLARWLHPNPVLGAGVLLATSVMFYYPVPPGLAPVGPSLYRTAAGGIQLTLHLAPNRSGPNQVMVTLRDRRGRPVSLAHVTLLNTMLDMHMGTGLAALTSVGNGIYRGNAELGMGGHWRIEILVYQPTGLTRMSVKAEVGT